MIYENNNVIITNEVSISGGRTMFDLYGLVLKSKKISSPQFQTKNIEIPARSGSIDLSRSVSNIPRYRDRKIEMTFIELEKRVKYEDVLTFMTSIRTKLIGWDKVKFYFTEDMFFFYEGRVDSVDYSWDKSLLVVKVVATVLPFKYLTKKMDDINLAELNNGNITRYMRYVSKDKMGDTLNYNYSNLVTDFPIYIKVIDTFRKTDYVEIVSHNNTLIGDELYKGEEIVVESTLDTMNTLTINSHGEVILDVIIAGGAL